LATKEGVALLGLKKPGLSLSTALGTGKCLSDLTFEIYEKLADYRERNYTLPLIRHSMRDFDLKLSFN
jgi:hypothetical protein